MVVYLCDSCSRPLNNCAKKTKLFIDAQSWLVCNNTLYHDAFGAGVLWLITTADLTLCSSSRRHADCNARAGANDHEMNQTKLHKYTITYITAINVTSKIKLDIPEDGAKDHCLS